MSNDNVPSSPMKCDGQITSLKITVERSRDCYMGAKDLKVMANA